MRSAPSRATNPHDVEMATRKQTFDHEILLLQGGGALGAYHAGVHEGLAELGREPTWVVGVSIGAITAALIAGNPPARRGERLRAFWERISGYAPHDLPAGFESLRASLQQLERRHRGDVRGAGLLHPAHAAAVPGFRRWPRRDEHLRH